MTDCGHKLYWRGMYRGNFDLITPESIAHPAKMSPKLCFRILEHLEELGLLHQGDTILDPMAGTGMTAIVACAKGYRAVTVELEEKFIGFQVQNKAYAARRLHKDLDWTILQGDARNLSQMLGERGLVTVSSPPYEETNTGLNRDSDLIRMKEKGMKTPGPHSTTRMKFNYGTTPGQIGNLKDRPITITSPPYGAEGHPSLGSVNKDDWGNEGIDIAARRGLTGDYGHTEGQIGALKDKSLVSVTSPPYEDAINDKRTSQDRLAQLARNVNPDQTGRETARVMRKGMTPHGNLASVQRYSNMGGNIGQDKGEDYLSAMRLVYAEIAKVADVLAIVIKNPTRNGKLRRLDLDTIELLKQTGWTIHCQHRALLFEEQEQGHLLDGSTKQVKGRLSFFKRLSWKSGAPVASWEDVILAVK